MDPAKAFDKASLEFLGSTYEPLYQYHYLIRPHRVIPLLAIGQPEVSEDGLVYRINIKKNVRYHDHPEFKGKPRTVKAEDFVTQIKRLSLPQIKSPGATLLKGLIKGFDQFPQRIGGDLSKVASTSLEGVISLDEHLLEIRLEKKVSNLSHLLTLNFFVPFPSELLGKINPENEIIGTGPFYLHSKTNFGYTLKKFPHYRKELYPSVGDRESHTEELLTDAHKEIPFLDGVEYKIINSDDQAWKEFMNKKIHFMDVPKSKMNEIIDYSGKINKSYASEGIKLDIYPAMINRWISFNFKDMLLGKNKNLRKAISLAIDPNLYNIEIKQSTAHVANSIYTPGIEGYDPNQSLGQLVDLEEAKHLMRKEGYGPQKRLKITYSTRSKGPDGIEEAQFLKKTLAEIWIDLEVEYLDFSEFLKKGRNGELQFFTDNWIYDFPAPENMLQLLYSKNHPGVNKSAFSNNQFDSLFKKLETTNDPTIRKGLLVQLQQEVLKEVPWVMLCYERDVMVIHQEVHNLRKSSFIKNFTKYIRLH